MQKVRVTQELLVKKEFLRKEMKKRLEKEHFFTHFSIIQNLKKNYFKPNSIIAGYWPLAHEINILPFLSLWIESGGIACLPSIVENNIVFRPWTPLSTMKLGDFNIKEPASFETVVPDYILLPLLAFDKMGYRLGRGGGFYDRALSHLRQQDSLICAIGIGTEKQCVEDVPRNEQDERLDKIVIESGVIQLI
ncbi:MAG: 5-formyltetrahydrofolate cyclo-ligase [Alphaproteobacteria bacterium]